MEIGMRVRLDNGKEGNVTAYLTKEETKECLMYGQWIQVQLDDGSTEEHCYGYEPVEAVEEMEK